MHTFLTTAKKPGQYSSRLVFAFFSSLLLSSNPTKSDTLENGRNSQNIFSSDVKLQIILLLDEKGIDGICLAARNEGNDTVNLGALGFNRGNYLAICENDNHIEKASKWYMLDVFPEPGESLFAWIVLKPGESWRGVIGKKMLKRFWKEIASEAPSGDEFRLVWKIRELPLDFPAFKGGAHEDKTFPLHVSNQILLKRWIPADDPPLELNIGLTNGTENFQGMTFRIRNPGLFSRNIPALNSVLNRLEIRRLTTHQGLAVGKEVFPCIDEGVGTIGEEVQLKPGGEYLWQLPLGEKGISPIVPEAGLYSIEWKIFRYETSKEPYVSTSFPIAIAEPGKEFDMGKSTDTGVAPPPTP